MKGYYSFTVVSRNRRRFLAIHRLDHASITPSSQKRSRCQDPSHLFQSLIRHNPPIPRMLSQSIPLPLRLMVTKILRPRRQPSPEQLRRLPRNPAPQIRTPRCRACKVKLALPRHPALHLENVDARTPGRGGHIGSRSELAGGVIEGVADHADGCLDIGFLVFADDEAVGGGAAVEGDPGVAEGGVGLLGLPVEFPVGEVRIGI